MSPQPNGKMMFTDHNGEQIPNFSAKSLTNEYTHRSIKENLVTKVTSLDRKLNKVYQKAKVLD